MTAMPVTPNGNALYAFIEAAADYLGSMEALDYYRQPLPSESDARLLQIVERFRESTRDERAAILAAFSASRKSLFGLFAHRAATQAVREQNNVWLEAAFLSTVIANQQFSEARVVELPLAVLHHCARELGRKPSDLFDWAATFATGPLTIRLQQFGQREDVSLKKYGWVERRTPAGVTFSYLWR